MVIARLHLLQKECRKRVGSKSDGWMDRDANKKFKIAETRAVASKPSFD